MTYANVPFAYGPDRFMEDCAVCGIDGLILPDLPFEEKAEFEPACAAHGVALISLVAPTSKERTARIAGEAAGFLYLVATWGSREQGPGSIRIWIRSSEISGLIRIVRWPSGSAFPARNRPGT